MLLALMLLVDSPLIITEVMSNVRGSDGGSGSPGDRNEYVEIYNKSADTVDLYNYFIDDFDIALPDTVCPWTNDSILINYPNVRINSTHMFPYSYALILDREYVSLDTSGGYWQPYDIPDSLLILTTDETTICDGLTNTDPIILYSLVDACTTTFGTPYDTLDYFPYDPGDGISWERIDYDVGDTAVNWHISLDSSGCTPGRENSTVNAFDLAVYEQSVFYTPAVVKTGEDVVIGIVVYNHGLRGTDDYSLTVFTDLNNNGVIDDNETISSLSGIFVNDMDSITLFYTYVHPAQGVHRLGFRVDFTLDRNPTNNMAFKELLVIGEIGELALSPRVFSPDNDGVNDQLQIDYRLPMNGGYLTIAVFDTRGKLRHTICKREYCSGDRGTVFWDGQATGQTTASGMYIIYLEYQYQNTTTKAKKTAVLLR